MKFTLDNLTVQAKSAPPSMDSELHRLISGRCGLKHGDILGYKILKRSVDARKKPDVKIIYKLVIDVREGAAPSIPLQGFVEETPAWRIPEKASSLKNPIVVGSGPAGLFAALTFALAGCDPIVVERGFDVARRKSDIDSFFKTRVLNPESNLLFGEGGAGAWSDGKLYTRVRDPRMIFFLDAMVEAGAPEQARYFSHPHIGSDKLPKIVSNIRKRIESLGGRFIWGSKVSGIVPEAGKCKGVRLSNGETLEAPATVVACGHSARELILSIALAGVAHSLKGFQIGFRIEHPQAFVNFIQYGMEEPPPALGAAEYNMSSRPALDGSAPGATSFCMCPGGTLLPATSDEAQLSTNGMSESSRAGRFANSAIVVGQEAGAFRDAAEAFGFLQSVERAAFKAGGGDYAAPAQTALAFLKGELAKIPEGSSYSLGLKPAMLERLVPQRTADGIKRALRHFDKMAPGFVRHGVLAGVESRVSSPLRFERNPETLETSMPGLYIAGEGAGMAGGISSAAVDGIKAAEAILLKK